MLCFCFDTFGKKLQKIKVEDINKTDFINNKNLNFEFIEDAKKIYFKPYFDIDFYTNEIYNNDDLYNTFKQYRKILSEKLNIEPDNILGLYEEQKLNVNPSNKDKGKYKVSMHLNIKNYKCKMEDLKEYKNILIRELHDILEPLNLCNIDPNPYFDGMMKWRTISGIKKGISYNGSTIRFFISFYISF